MPAYKDKKTGKWYASFYFTNYNGIREKKLKRGFETKKMALEWEREFLRKSTADLDNNRKFTAQNVDAERTKNNITYCNENIRTVYHKLFDEALEKYNAKQTRKDRIIKNYYKKISQESKQEKPFTEVIVQVGDKNTMGVETEYCELATKILDPFLN